MMSLLRKIRRIAIWDKLLVSPVRIRGRIYLWAENVNKRKIKKSHLNKKQIETNLENLRSRQNLVTQKNY